MTSKQQEKDEEFLEEKIWEWRKLTIGVKNITDIKKQKIEEIFEVLECPTIDIYIEIHMDMLKFLWKCVLMNKMSLFEFELKQNEYYIIIETKDNFSESTKYDYEIFKRDMKSLIKNYKESENTSTISIKQMYKQVMNELVIKIKNKWIENNKNWYKKMIKQQNERKHIKENDNFIVTMLEILSY
jgi:hypothetical protein